MKNIHFSFSKKTAAFLAVPFAVLATTSIVLAAVSFGPSRPTFTWASPANYITFNSITDNPTWGDERQLLKVRDASQGSSANATSAPVTDNEEVQLTVYFHNNAESGLNLVATNTQVKISLPSTAGTTVTPTAYITADNATPHQVFATADLTNSQPFTLAYESGTAKLYTNYVSGLALSDNVVNGGVLVGSQGANGNVPGCAQFSGYVVVKARVHVQPAPVTTFSSTKTATASASATATATATCGKGATASVTTTTASATASSSATASATSTASQSDADAQAQATAQAQANSDAQAKANAAAKAAAESAATSKCTPGSTPGAPIITSVQSGVVPALPNTGPGDVLGVFAGASSAGTAAHMYFKRRKR